MRYQLEVLRRARVPFTDLKSLCADIPERGYETAELVAFNDFYGNAEQLKRFLRIPSCFQFKAAIQHGNQYGDVYWDEEIGDVLPVSLAWGEHIYSVWRKHTRKKIFKIGAPFFYTEGLLGAAEVERVRARLGRNLLVFPAHSMHHSTVSFDVKGWLDKVRDVGRGFDSIRICMYWKDYLLGRHVPYLEAGYECVTAGHIFDCNFLPRLRSLLEISDASLSNRIGSFIGYSVFLGRPHVYIDQRMDIVDHGGIGRVQQEEDGWRGDPGVQNIFQSFSSEDFVITDAQVKALEPYFGFSEIKSRAELADIFMLAEGMYRQRGVFPGFVAASSYQQRYKGNMKKQIKRVLRPLWRRLPLRVRRLFGHEADVMSVSTKFGDLKFYNVNGMTKYRVDTFFTKEPETLAWIESFTHDAILWDIGANVGLYSCYAVLASKARVVAFEPHPFNVEMLVRNILLNGMSGNVDMCTLPLSSITRKGGFNMSCCYSGASGATFGEVYGQDGQAMEGFSSVTLFGTSADDFVKVYGLECPDYVKIDVDGIEHLILKGMQSVLENTKLKGVLVECCDLFCEQKREVHDILLCYGFNLKEVGTSPLYSEGVDSYTRNYIYGRSL